MSVANGFIIRLMIVWFAVFSHVKSAPTVTWEPEDPELASPIPKFESNRTTDEPSISNDITVAPEVLPFIDADGSPEGAQEAAEIRDAAIKAELLEQLEQAYNTTTDDNVHVHVHSTEQPLVETESSQDSNIVVKDLLANATAAAAAAYIDHLLPAESQVANGTDNEDHDQNDVMMTTSQAETYDLLHSMLDRYGHKASVILEDATPPEEVEAITTTSPALDQGAVATTGVAGDRQPSLVTDHQVLPDENIVTENVAEKPTNTDVMDAVAQADQEQIAYHCNWTQPAVTDATSSAIETTAPEQLGRLQTPAEADTQATTNDVNVDVDVDHILQGTTTLTSSSGSSSSPDVRTALLEDLFNPQPMAMSSVTASTDQADSVSYGILPSSVAISPEMTSDTSSGGSRNVLSRLVDVPALPRQTQDATDTTNMIVTDPTAHNAVAEISSTDPHLTTDSSLNIPTDVPLRLGAAYTVAGDAVHTADDIAAEIASATADKPPAQIQSEAVTEVVLQQQQQQEQQQQIVDCTSTAETILSTQSSVGENQDPVSYFSQYSSNQVTLQQPAAAAQAAVTTPLQEITPQVTGDATETTIPGSIETTENLAVPESRTGSDIFDATVSGSTKAEQTYKNPDDPGLMSRNALASAIHSVVQDLIPDTTVQFDERSAMDFVGNLSANHFPDNDHDHLPTTNAAAENDGIVTTEPVRSTTEFGDNGTSTSPTGSEPVADDTTSNEVTTSSGETTTTTTIVTSTSGEDFFRNTPLEGLVNSSSIAASDLTTVATLMATSAALAQQNHHQQQQQQQHQHQVTASHLSIIDEANPGSHQALLGPVQHESKLTCTYSGHEYTVGEHVEQSNPCHFCVCGSGGYLDCYWKNCPPAPEGCVALDFDNVCDRSLYVCPIPKKGEPLPFPVNSIPASRRRRAISDDKMSCDILGVQYRVGELVGVASDPCMECRCALDSLYCSPKCCFQPSVSDTDPTKNSRSNDVLWQPVMANPLKHLRYEFERLNYGPHKK